MDAIIMQYRERQEELVADTQAILARSDAEKRDLDNEEAKQIDENTAEFDRLKAEIGRRERAIAQAGELNASAGRRTVADAEAFDDDGPARPQARGERARPAETVPERPRAQVLGQTARQSATYGFRHFGEYVAAVRTAGVRGGDVDQRLMAATASTYGNEGAGGDGGFAVPPEYRATILERVLGEDSLLSRCDQQTASGNSMTYPSDSTVPWGSDGIQAYWESEASAMTQTKPKIGDNTVRLHKLAALVPMTEELLEDAPAMGSYVARKAAEKIDFKVSNAIARGNGVGQPLGFLNSPALVTVAAESGQTADTIVAANVVKMYAAMPSRNRMNAIWLIHPDAEPQLSLMTLGQMPVYLPPGGLSNNPYGTLFGRPVIPHQVCETVGDVFDIGFVDLSQYLALIKAGGLKSQTSIHLWFDQDLTAFKFTLRIGGQPWWASSVASRDGSFALSPFVTLAAR